MENQHQPDALLIPQEAPPELSILELQTFRSLPTQTQLQLLRMPLDQTRLYLLLLMEAIRARYEIKDSEMILMVDSLKSFPLQKVQRAFEHIRMHPPAGYRGMPGEADVIASVRQIEQDDASEWERKEKLKLAQEMRDLQARKDAGEEFFTWGDVVQAVAEKIGRDPIEAKAFPGTPPAPAPPTAEDYEFADRRRAEMLEGLRAKYPEALR